MKLYVIAGSPNSRKVLAVVKHLGIDIETHSLDLFKGDNKQAEYLSLNPNGMVPCLVDGDLSLWESNAINQFLADTVQGQDIYPEALSVRADINRWLSWELAHFNQAFGTLALEAVAKPKFMQSEGEPAVIKWAQEQLARFSSVLNSHLENRMFVVGESVTIADYAMIHVEFFKESVPFDWSPYPHLNAYFDRIRQSPIWQSTAASSIENIGRVVS
ncbi:glutathione S-transferase family protein [Vibrio sp. SCSIO 43137]|uniref:glutathione S-transferase family protein n=1 Tax=Vibrio sp. SCSIO 43137 TaxID=3021011 RepID=UPI002306E843|nr:glutathione S-transferase family protein [Vibrio sp. SCSIO 43137]WCE32034.1 glutathione S-transferase family protein [Vibrio sp. SCSIO 43137]